VPPGSALIDGSTVKGPPDDPLVPVDPELPEPDEPELPPPEEPVPLDAVNTGVVPKGFMKPFKRGCVIAVGVMPKAATGD
jgi:hypothetical protein